VLQGTVAGREVLQIDLLEHPLLSGWSVRGVENVAGAFASGVAL
jgi:hypothetical protein